MTFAEYLTEVAKDKAAHPEWRMGQTYFNTLQRVEPELAEHFRGAIEDPFYRDENIGEFLSLLCDMWI